MERSAIPRGKPTEALKHFEIAKVQRFSAESTQCGGDQEFDDAMNEERSCIAAKFSHRNHTAGRPFLGQICHPGRYGRFS
ncbi:hypothetical protein CEXT_638981 [Caerostris extrusa]|uniref:Uncharacterized protein n=1 Tax=Caerostris extrusa TaxID=172846 RepID=A0AAV4R098_CAEEX|nr:hypothetical protein CEXT_638981 [Caerostris extrusa]